MKRFEDIEKEMNIDHRPGDFKPLIYYGHHYFKDNKYDSEVQIHIESDRVGAKGFMNICADFSNDLSAQEILDLFSSAVAYRLGIFKEEGSETNTRS